MAKGVAVLGEICSKNGLSQTHCPRLGGASGRLVVGW